MCKLPQNYVNNIKYDEFGSRTYFEYGNGVSSAYIYNSATRRLQNLPTTAINGSLHHHSYTYDPVGNITNTAISANGLGGSFSYNDSYDLYRLDTSDGSGSIDAAYTFSGKERDLEMRSIREDQKNKRYRCK